MRRVCLLIVATCAVVATLTGVAAAHVQVLPATVAPGDPTLFTVLVPNERDDPTVQVDLQIPPGVIPFGFEATPGWERSETTKPDGSLDVVTWAGSLPAGEFVRFSFLASPPDEEGTIQWPAVQTYGDGTKVRWIGDEGSEEPAAVTVVSAGAASQNAGGEGATSTGPAQSEAAPSPDDSSSSADDSSSSADDGSSNTLAIVALAVGGAGLVAGLAALVLARRSRMP
jgi:uncharacterized protein YcnI